MELRMPTPEQLRTVYAADLKESFPASELKPLRAIEQMWADGRYYPWCLFDGDEIVGTCFFMDGTSRLGAAGLSVCFLPAPQWRHWGGHSGEDAGTGTGQHHSG